MVMMVSTRDDGLQEGHDVTENKGVYFSGDPKGFFQYSKGS